MINMNHILEGWANVIKNEIGLLSPEKKLISEKRLVCCDTCTMRIDNTCSRKKESLVVKDFYYKVLEKNRKKGQLVKGCGCNLSAKSMCEDCQCPLGKWEDI